MKTLIYIGFALICAAAAVACGQLQTQTLSLSERVDKYFADNPDRFMGSIEIQENGKTVYEKSLGFADIENKIPAKADTKFRIGSITKTFMWRSIFPTRISPTQSRLPSTNSSTTAAASTTW